MKSFAFFTTALAAVASTVGAVSVSGAAEGFAKGVTGGGSATAVYPSTTDELVSYLGDSTARVIVLTKTFDFRGTEGTTTSSGCAPCMLIFISFVEDRPKTDSIMQGVLALAAKLYDHESFLLISESRVTNSLQAIDKDDWCENYEPDAPTVSSITYDAAGTLGITVASDKSIVGDGSSGVIKGKGLRIVNGATNVIIQNVAITDINPEYVWGGDAITLDGTDNVWIDHVTVSRAHPLWLEDN